MPWNLKLICLIEFIELTLQIRLDISEVKMRAVMYADAMLRLLTNISTCSNCSHPRPVFVFTSDVI